MKTIKDFRKKDQKKYITIVVLVIAVMIMKFVCTFVGSSNMTLQECVAALLKKSTVANHVRIIWNIRIPRVLAAVIAGAGLSVSGLIMQTNLNNAMASLVKDGGRVSIAHGMSRSQIDGHHNDAASKVSNGLMHENELKKLFEPYFDVDVVISNDKMYQVSGVKRTVE